MVGAREGFASGWDWLIAAVIGCALIFIPYLVYAEDRYFAVTAYNEWGESDYSEEISADIPDGSGCTLSWDTVSEADGYKVYWGKASREYGTPVDTGTGDSHIFIRPPAPGNITVIP